MGWLSQLDLTASLSAQREGRHRRRLGTTGPDSIRTNFRDDVLTPGVSAVAKSLVEVGSRLIALTWGSEYYHDQLKSSGTEENLNSGSVTDLVRQGSSGDIPTGNFPDGANADRFGVFLSVEYPIIEEIVITAGGRYSLFRSEADNGIALGGLVENTASALTGQIGVLTAPHRNWRIVARVAQGFRAPNLYDLTRTGPVPGGVSLPNPSATPENSLSSELSIRYGTSTTAFNVTGYYTSITDFIDRVPGSFMGDTLFDGERVFQGINVGKARVWGIEAEAAQQIGPIEARTNLFYTVGDQTPASNADEPMSKIPPLSGMVNFRWTAPNHPFWGEYIFRWSTLQDRLGVRDLNDTRIQAGGTPGFTVHGLRAGASIATNLDVSVGFENITDALYRTHASGVDAAAQHVWVGLNWVGSF
jgi:outer membrane receptor protein involved in Fe transport